ncbi:MAG: carbohydrate binding domain-containing protein [Candidatus Omnitrophota bacterium]
MNKIIFSLLFICGIAAGCFAESQGLLIDDFEVAISGGPEGTVDFGAGSGSSVEVSADTGIKYSGNQSLKVAYDAIPDGYMWVARGFGLDAGNAAWLIKPQDIKWEDYNAFSFYMYGSGNKAQVAFDIKDNGNEMWRFLLEDNFKGWKQIILPFNEFFCRGDWQPDSADKNANLDFPIKSFQFEPRPEAKGTVYFDKVELIKK